MSFNTQKNENFSVKENGFRNIPNSLPLLKLLQRSIPKILLIITALQTPLYPSNQISIYTDHFLGGAIVGQSPHPDDDVVAPRQEGLRLRVGAAGDVHEVLPLAAVALDVPAAEVVLVPLQGHVPVLLAHEPYQRFAVASSLGRKAKCHSASGGGKGEELSGSG